MSRLAFMGASLILTLILCSANVKGDVIDVNASQQYYGALYTNLTINLRKLEEAQEQFVTVNFYGFKLVGEYAELICFWSLPEKLKAEGLAVSLVQTELDYVTLTLDGYLPPQSKVSILGTVAYLSTDQPVFNLGSFYIANNMTVTISDTVIRWVGKDQGWVVTMESNTAVNSITGRSALFIFNTTMFNSKGVFHARSIANLTMDDYSVLAIDYGLCNECSHAVAMIDMPMIVKGGSMVRISNSNTVDAPIVHIATPVILSDGSLLLFSDNVATNNGLFKIESEGSVIAMLSSAVTYRRLRVQESEIKGQTIVPFADASSKSYGDNCVVGDLALANLHDYTQKKLFITTLVTSDGHESSSTTCAQSGCIPKASTPTTAFGGVCECACKDQFHRPDCTFMADPLLGRSGPTVVPTPPGPSSSTFNHATPSRTLPVTLAMLFVTLLAAGVASA